MIICLVPGRTNIVLQVQKLGSVIVVVYLYEKTTYGLCLHESLSLCVLI
jgi:hypothetical protein